MGIPGFQFLLEAFTLLMGLAMAEVLRGFSRVLKLRSRRKAGLDIDERRIRIGWLVPMLGLFVILDQATFWLHMFGYREIMPFNAASLMGILFVIGWYYLVASLVFPDEPRDWPDFDLWYWQQKRTVVGCVLGINILSTIASIALSSAEQQERVAAEMTPIVALASVITLLIIPAMIWLYFSKNHRVNIALLAFCIVSPIFYAVMTIGGEMPS